MSISKHILKICCTHFLPSCSRSDRDAQDISIFCVPGFPVAIAVNKNVDHRCSLTLPGNDTLTNHLSLLLPFQVGITLMSLLLVIRAGQSPMFWVIPVALNVIAGACIFRLMLTILRLPLLRLLYRHRKWEIQFSHLSPPDAFCPWLRYECMSGHGHKDKRSLCK